MMKRYILCLCLCLTMLLPLSTLCEGDSAAALFTDRKFTTAAAAAITLPVGSHQSLYAVLDGRWQRNAVWQSSAEDVAACESGRIEALSVGTADITCTIDDTVLRMAVTVYQPVTSVTLPVGLSLYAGDTLDAAAAVLPENASNPAVAYTVDDPAVLVVDQQGQIIALHAGVARLTAAAQDGSGKSATVRIHVSAVPTEVTVTPTAYAGVCGDTFRIRAAVVPSDVPEKSVVWYTSDPSVATVDERGVVSMLSSGSATITAVSSVSTEAMGSCAVTVTRQAASITVTGCDAPLIPGEVCALTAAVLPENADNHDVIWVSRNIHVATVDDMGRVTALKIGSAEIEAEAADGSGVKGKIKIVVGENASRLTLNPSEASLAVGQSLVLTGETSPRNAINRELVWHADPEGIVALTPGSSSVTVTGLRWGSAVVTAATARGQLEAVCQVRVGTGIDALLLTPVVLDGQPQITIENVSDMTVTEVTLALRGYSEKKELLMLGTNGDPTLLGRAAIRLAPGDSASLALSDLTLLTPLRSCDGLACLKVAITAYTTDAASVEIPAPIWFTQQ